MLDKLILHQKNVFFFKAVIYVVIIVGLITMLPVAKNNLVSAAERREKAESFLNQANLRLSSLIDFEENIANTNKRFLDLVDSNGLFGCQDRAEFTRQVMSLAADARKFSDIDLNITKITDPENKLIKRGVLQNYQYKATIKFSTVGHKEFFEFGKKLEKVLPKGYFIVTSEISSTKALTPEMIRQLTPNKKPKLYNAYIKLMLNEIAYDA